ncbi:hypothetical protein MMC10_007068 [Thelotrema lepadinum]|nr:hypothetical protein [Thelotrema lepadinum]
MPIPTRALLTLPKLLEFKAIELKTLAQCIGLTHTGTKPELASRIVGSLQCPKQQREGDNGKNGKRGSRRVAAEKKGTRILSIDMGVRNLAYCVLDVYDAPVATTTRAKGKKQRDSMWLPRTNPFRSASSTASASSKSPILATVTAWSRLSVTSLSQATDPNADPYSLYSLSLSANALINTLVVSSSTKRPDTVLIEKQRWRSMSSAAIQQWTVRVNTFEAMLWAVLGAAKDRGEWEGEVWGIDPGGVGRWVVGPEAKEAKRGKGKGKSKVKEGKKEKVAVVKGWLERGEMVEVEGEQPQRVKAGLLDAGRGRGKKKGKKSSETVGVVEKEVDKWDDLADCLLQAVAWMQWERNKTILLERGLDAFVKETVN